MAVSNPFIEFYSEITLIRELAYANSQDRYFLKNLVVVSSKPKEVKLEVPLINPRSSFVTKTKPEN